MGPLSLLNVANVPVTLYALHAAYRRDVGASTVATALSMTLKFAFVAAPVRRFEEGLGDLETPTAVGADRTGFGPPPLDGFHGVNHCATGSWPIGNPDSPRR